MLNITQPSSDTEIDLDSPGSNQSFVDVLWKSATDWVVYVKGMYQVHVDVLFESASVYHFWNV